MRGPGYSGQIVKNETTRGKFSIHRSRLCVVIPTNRTLRKREAQDKFALAGGGINKDMIKTAVQHASCKQFTIHFDETDLRPALIQKADGSWIGDVDFSTQTLDGRDPKTVRMEMDAHVAAFSQAASQLHQDLKGAQANVQVMEPENTAIVRLSKFLVDAEVMLSCLSLAFSVCHASLFC